LKRQTRADARPRPSAGPGGPGGPKMGEGGDRGSYRRTAPGGDKVGAAGAGSAPMEFRGGFGRGKTE
jgi:SSU ribosomal protein S10E